MTQQLVKELRDSIFNLIVDFTKNHSDVDKGEVKKLMKLIKLDTDFVTDWEVE